MVVLLDGAWGVEWFRPGGAASPREQADAIAASATSGTNEKRRGVTTVTEP